MKFDQASDTGHGCDHTQLEFRDDDGPAIACTRCEKRWPMRGGPAFAGPPLPEPMATAARALAEHQSMPPAPAAFDAEWDELAKEGVCDSYGGAEYLRVRLEWERGGRPEITTFIRERANVGPR